MTDDGSKRDPHEVIDGMIAFAESATHLLDGDPWLDDLRFIRAALAATPDTTGGREALDEDQRQYREALAMADDLARASAKVHRLSGLPAPEVRMDVWQDIASEVVYHTAARRGREADDVWEALLTSTSGYSNTEQVHEAIHHYRPLIEAALAAAPSSTPGDGLDVARLTRALLVEMGMIGDSGGRVRRKAERIAAEYERAEGDETDHSDPLCNAPNPDWPGRLCVRSSGHSGDHGTASGVRWRAEGDGT